MRKFRWKTLVLITVCCVDEVIPNQNEVRMDHFFHEREDNDTESASTEETVYENTRAPEVIKKEEN